jgi:uncharacterized OsmC-like protein
MLCRAGDEERTLTWSFETAAMLDSARRRSGRARRIEESGDLDVHGTLAVSKEAPVGFRSIRLNFKLETDASGDELDTLLRLTERYCIVYQTLAGSPALTVGWARASG